MAALNTKPRRRRSRGYDGRTWQARLARDVRRGLVEHVGGAPSPVEAALIGRAAQLAVHLAEIDARIVSGADGPSDRAEYAGLSHSLVDALGRLGAKPSPRTMTAAAGPAA